MLNNQYNQFSLSVDEAALVFSILDQAEQGKGVLFDAYGQLDPETTEIKLITASHSLVARDIVTIKSDGEIVLNKNLETVFLPLIDFENIIQVSINTDEDQGPEIINIYIGNNKTATSLRVRMGVAYQINHGKLADLDQLILSWLNLPETANDDMGDRKFKINLMEFSELGAKPKSQGKNFLKELGCTDDLAEALWMDINNPVKRGAVVLTDTNSDNYQTKNVNEAGRGFLFLQGSNASWIVSFETADDHTEGTLLSGRKSSTKEEILQIINDIS